MSTDAKIYSLLGLAQRAGQLISGDMSLENALRKGQGELLLIAADCGANNRKKYEHLATREKIEYILLGNRDELGEAIGKGHRAAVLVMNTGFAEAIRKLRNG